MNIKLLTKIWLKIWLALIVAFSVGVFIGTTPGIQATPSFIMGIAITLISFYLSKDV